MWLLIQFVWAFTVDIPPALAVGDPMWLLIQFVWAFTVDIP